MVKQSFLSQLNTVKRELDQSRQDCETQEEINAELNETVGKQSAELHEMRLFKQQLEQNMEVMIKCNFRFCQK